MFDPSRGRRISDSPFPPVQLGREVPATIANPSSHVDGLGSLNVPSSGGLASSNYAKQTAPPRLVAFGSAYHLPDQQHASLPAASDRAMRRAELLGGHTHVAVRGEQVHVWERDGKFIARGSYQGRRFGETLGADPIAAASRLRQILVEIESGSYVRPTESRSRPLRKGPTPRLTLRELVDRCLTDKRKLTGKNTAATYLSRLVPVFEFAETPQRVRRWRYAEEIDRSFVVDLRAWLFSREVARNGHSNALKRRLTSSQVRNVLGTLGMVLNWAKRADVGLLAITFANPVSYEILPPKAMRDPLAPPELPLSLRIEMVGMMDAWQLSILGLPFVLPCRPDELSGLLISDASFAPRELVFNGHFGGDDHSKARLAFRVPFPPELEALLRWSIGERTEGPLLRKRTVVEGSRLPRLTYETHGQLNETFGRFIANQGSHEVQSQQDRKRCFRQFLRSMGGVGEDEMAREFKKTLQLVRPGQSTTFYKTRTSVTTDMKNAGVDVVFRRYITAHSLEGEIFGHYEHQDLELHMGRLFDHLRPLLNAIAERAGKLGITCSPALHSDRLEVKQRLAERNGTKAVEM